MFKILSILSPSYFKKLSKIIKDNFIIIAIILFSILAGIIIYNDFKHKLQEIEKNKELVLKQQQTIKDQKTMIEDLNKQMQFLKESNEKTLYILQELKSEQESLDKKAVTRREKIDKSIKEVKDKPITDIEKSKQVSAILINGLNGTYCELFVENCETSLGK